MRLIKKHTKKLVMLAMMLLLFVVQLRAQFDDDGGPGDFDPPPDNDVPLDTYQWVFLCIALAYGVYMYIKHQKQIAVKEECNISLTAE